MTNGQYNLTDDSNFTGDARGTESSTIAGIDKRTADWNATVKGLKDLLDMPLVYGGYMHKESICLVEDEKIYKALTSWIQGMLFMLSMKKTAIQDKDTFTQIVEKEKAYMGILDDLLFCKKSFLDVKKAITNK